MSKLIQWMTPMRSKETIRIILLIIYFISSFHNSYSQRQLIFLKHGNVVARFFEGSRVECVLKDGRQKEGIIRGLTEFSMVTLQDTIAFQSIAKMNVRNQHQFNLQRGIGGLFFLGGVFYLVVDGANKALGYTTGGYDQGDTYALAFAGAGAAMIFIKPRYLRMTDGVIIRTIDRDSQYYQIVN